MKEISKKIIEAGLVDKHTLSLMRRWGYLDEVVDDLKRQQFVDTFKEFVEDLDELLEAKEEEGIKETRFSVTISDPIQIFFEGGPNTSVVAFHDEMDRLIFPPTLPIEDCLAVGNKFMGGGKLYTVVEVVPLWHGDVLYAFQVQCDIL